MSKHSLGVSNGKLAPMPRSPNAVGTHTDQESKRVADLAMIGSVTETKQHILACLQKMGGNVVQSETDTYVHAVFTTRLMRFKDDVEFYIDEANQQVHFRSASRVGHSDLGANRKRYNAFRALYQQKSS
ncbi:MAG: DUF1499 domain-containing protein [Pseudomonadota bacterium]